MLQWMPLLLVVSMFACENTHSMALGLFTRGSTWIIVVMDHFTRLANALAIPNVLDQYAFCYFGLLEEMHVDQNSHF